jgi:hypothetical protein
MRMRPVPLLKGQRDRTTWTQGYERAGEPVALSFISISPRRIEHHSLCSAIGMPHSTHTRIRCFGGSLFPSNRFHKDMPPPGMAIGFEYVRRWNGVPG